MQEQLTGFIKTAEALQIKGLAAVNNNQATSSSNNNNDSFTNNNNIKAENGKYNSSTPIQDITKLNAYGPQTPNNIKYELNSNSYSPPPMPLTPTESIKSPLSLYKKRRWVLQLWQ